MDNLNKIGFGVLSVAALMQLLKKQRDAVGLSIYSNEYNFHATEKNSERHYQMLLSKLNEVVIATKHLRNHKDLYLSCIKLPKKCIVAALFFFSRICFRPKPMMPDFLMHYAT